MTQKSMANIYVGLIILVGLIIGGGAQKGLWTILVLELLCVPLVVLLAVSERHSTYSKLVTASLCFLGLAFVIQLIPGLGLLSPGRPAGEQLQSLIPPPAFLSMDVGRTLDSLLYTIVIVLFFVVTVRKSAAQQERLLPFLFLGAAVNIVFALVQYAASNRLAADFLPYSFGTGFFANPNHFAALLYVTIPFVVYQFSASGRTSLSLLPVGLIIFVQFAVSSVAGTFLSLACAMVSYAVIPTMRVWRRGTLLGIVVIGAGVISLNPQNVLEVRADDPMDRTTITATTLRAIPNHIPFGSGFGTFEIVYPEFETDDQILRTYINNAHNDFLENILEGGVLAFVALLIYLACIVIEFKAASRYPLKVAALCAIAFLLIHSVVDYPLRTMGMALVFAFANALYFSRWPSVTAIKIRAKHESRGQ